MRAMRLRPLLILATCLASLPVLAGSASAKPKVAILGLEVTGSSSTDQKAISAADAITKELRREAQRDSGPFELAPNSNKTLLDIKMLSECSDEGTKCMSEVGEQMGAQRLIFGKLARKKGGYEVNLQLLNTESRKGEGTASATIPFNQVGEPGAIQRQAKALYGQLTGAPGEGEISITANAERGTVFADGEIKTSLSAGSARVSGLSEGAHTIAIEADGYERYETEVNVVAGETESLRASLVKMSGGGGGDDEGRPGRGWRVAFWSGVLATGAGGAMWAYSGLQVLSAEDDVDVASEAYMPGMDGPPPSPAAGSDGTYADACASFDGLDRSNQKVGAVLDACDQGKKHRNLVNFVFMPVTIGAALFSSFAFYKGYMQPKRMSAERAARRRKSSKRNMVVMPALGPDLIGAGLGIQF
jgi:TolB-like protein